LTWVKYGRVLKNFGGQWTTYPPTVPLVVAPESLHDPIIRGQSRYGGRDRYTWFAIIVMGGGRYEI